MHHVGDHHADGGHFRHRRLRLYKHRRRWHLYAERVPEGNTYTLVIQSGKWLNEFTEPSSGTLSGPISGLQLNMPTTHSATANIPLIAIQTGSADALECVFRDIGVATRSSPTIRSPAAPPSAGAFISIRVTAPR